jgi:hypothetical protein
VTRRWESAVLAIAFAAAGLVTLALLFAGPSTYEALARDTGFAPATFHIADDRGVSRTEPVELPRLLDLHERWLAYVSGRADAPPSEPGVVLFTADEYAHMADVRRVFLGFQVAAAIGGIAAILLVARVARRGRRAAFVLLRDAAIAAGAGVALVAVAAAVAFDRLFLLFHEVFFPQGNFLFDADSNLLAVYPDPYWYGVTLRVGLAFVVAMGVIAIAAAATLRRGHR